MAKRTSGGGGEDRRQLLPAAVVGYGSKRPIDPYNLAVARRALRAVADEGTLAVVELPNGQTVVT